MLYYITYCKHMHRQYIKASSPHFCTAQKGEGGDLWGAPGDTWATLSNPPVYPHGPNMDWLVLMNWCLEFH